MDHHLSLDHSSPMDNDGALQQLVPGKARKGESMSKVPPGLINRGGVWHIQKKWRGRRIRESTGTSDLREAERYMVHRLEEIRQQEVYGVRPQKTWKEAVVRYLDEETKASIRLDMVQLRHLDSYLGDLQLHQVHMGTLQPFIKDRKANGRKNRTVNYALQVVRHILNLASGEWIDQDGIPWLPHAPKIKLLREDDKTQPYPLSWEEQERLFAELPEHLRDMALFKVNTGCREAEVCRLKWSWEVPVEQMDTSVFIIPKEKVKNREERLVVLNRIASDVVETMRGKHPEYVFTYKGRPIQKMYGAAWRKARLRAELPTVRVHDLKHTFGRRLRAAGVSFEDRQDLLGHKSGRITTHYSRPELINLIQSANSVCPKGDAKGTTLVMLKRKRA